MELKVCTIDDITIVAPMIVDLMNYHRKMTNAPKEFWCTEEEGEESYRAWMEKGKIYLCKANGSNIGFFYLLFGGNDAAWLEDLYIDDEYRSRGYGRQAMDLLDEILKGDSISALFVDVIPRNTSAIEFYRELGFDHLNMIQLRKNYDSRLNKDDSIELLGYEFKKY